MKLVYRCSLLAFASFLLLAQNPNIKRTIVQKHDLSTPGHEVNMAVVEIAPGAFAGRHTHPGEEISYVLEGQMEVLIEGQATIKAKAGESFFVPAGAKHDAHNVGSTPVKLVGVYIIESGKPLATPAPQ